LAHVKPGIRYTMLPQ